VVPVITSLQRFTSFLGYNSVTVAFHLDVAKICGSDYFGRSIMIDPLFTTGHLLPNAQIPDAATCCGGLAAKTNGAKRVFASPRRQQVGASIKLSGSEIRFGIPAPSPLGKGAGVVYTGLAAER